MKTILSGFACFFFIPAVAQNTINVVPMPAEIQLGKPKEVFTINKHTKIFLGNESDRKIPRSSSINLNDRSGLEKYANNLNDSLQKKYGFKLAISKNRANKSSSNYIVLSFTEIPFTVKDYYTLNVTKKGISIAGYYGAGLFYGLQTFYQLLPLPDKATDLKNYPLSIPQLSIKDYPRFRYRGMHLDVARHFASVDFVKKYIDYLAFHKFNTFHWHLTDDQGWRIEIKKYPLLTQVGGCRAQTLVGRYGSDVYDGKKYCGYYTQEEIKEVIRYAAERHINIIPEIEMPGHALAALASYPYLGCTKGPYKAAETWGVFDDVFCAGNDSTFTFLQNVLEEVIDLFPSKYIHIGGDESPKTRWKVCRDCQERIRNRNLKDEHGLQSYFVQRMEVYLNSKGRKIIGWDEILEGGLAPNATVMSWRGEEGGIQAAKQKHDVIMTPGGWMYFDYNQSSNEDSVTIGGFIPLEKVYGYEPVPAALSAEEAKYVLGAQANVWREYMNNDKKTEYMIFPRMSALSEVLWSPKEKRNWVDFERRLPAVFERYKTWGANYSNAYYDLQSKVIPLGNNGIGWELKSKNSKGKIVYADEQPGRVYDQPVTITASGKFKAAMVDDNNKPVSNWITQEFFINKASGKKVTLATEPSKSYAGSGGFTLVDGVQNTMGMPKSSQFLGFSGDDLNAIIDLGKSESISEIIVHAFEQTGSWIYRPDSVSFYISDNGTDFQPLGSVVNKEADKNLLYTLTKNTNARFIKIHATNAGTIAEGKAGAGSKAWLFIDEVEIR